MKIIFCMGKMNKGGAERVICNLSNCFTSLGYQVVIIATEIKKQEYVFHKDVKFYTLPSSSLKTNIIKRTAIRLKALQKIILSENPDLICAFLQEPIARLLLLKLISGRIRKIPTVVSVRIDPATAFKGLRKLSLPLYNLSDGFVFQTSEIESFFNKRIRSRSAVISNPINPIFFKQDKKIKQEDLIISVGRLTEQKNYPMLFNAFKSISAKYPKLKLEIYGDGELKDYLTKQLKALDLQDKVSLKGNVKDIKSQLERAKIFVITSDYEGMSNALMEAMALGVPSISTNSVGGGAATLIHDHQNGLLIPRNNPPALSTGIDELLSDKQLYNHISKASKQSMLKYSPDVINKQWHSYLEAICERSKQ